MPRQRVPGTVRGVTHERCGTDEWKLRGGQRQSWQCVKCEREKALDSWRRNYSRAALARDTEVSKTLDHQPGKEKVTLPFYPLERAVERHLWLRSRDGQPARMQDIFSQAQQKAFYRAKKHGSITLRQADPLLDTMDMHPRELWGDEADRAAWGGALPPDFQRSDEVRRKGQVEQARASFADRGWELTTTDTIAARKRARASGALLRWDTGPLSKHRPR
jgi:hypothetical protein